MEEKKNPWILRVPSGKPDDALYNRRLLSYYSLIFAAIWVHEILVVIVVGMILGFPLDAGVVAALVGVPAALSGLGFWKYLEACKISDLKKPFDPGVKNEGQAEPDPLSAEPPPEVGSMGYRPTE